MKLNDMVLDRHDRSMVATTMWILFNSDKEAFVFRFFFVTINLRGRVRRWLEEKLGPDPLDIESMRART